MSVVHLPALLAALAAMGASGAQSTESVAACASTRCRCVPASALGISEDSLTALRRTRADVVLAARVTRVDTLADGGVVARLAVSRVWKGPRADTATVVLHPRGDMRSSCDLVMRAGERWLVFAQGIEGRLRVTQCTGSSPMDAAGPALGVLGAGAEPEGRRTSRLPPWDDRDAPPAAGVSLTMTRAEVEGVLGAPDTVVTLPHALTLLVYERRGVQVGIRQGVVEGVTLMKAGTDSLDGITVGMRADAALDRWGEEIRPDPRSGAAVWRAGWWEIVAHLDDTGARIRYLQLRRRRV